MIYSVTVKGFGRESVFKVEADSVEQARDKAMVECDITIRVVPSAFQEDGKYEPLGPDVPDSLRP